MCGIVAFVGRVFKAELGAFQDMLVMDAVRGWDSTGVYVRKGEDEYLVKMSTSPQDLMSTRQYKNAVDKYPDVLIGHNRYATVGVVNAANAHPFDVGNIVGVHNGTLTNWKSMKDSKQFTVDSECMLHNFDVVGVKETYKDLQGAVASVWYDKRTGTTFFLRNKERPLHYAETSDGLGLMLASEGWMIRVGAGRNNVKIEEIKEVPVDTLFEVKDGKIVSQVQLEAYKPTFSLAWSKKGIEPPFKSGETVVFDVLKLHYRTNSTCIEVECEVYKGKKPYKVKIWLDSDKVVQKELADKLNDSPFQFSGMVSYSNEYSTSIIVETVKELVQSDIGEEYESCDVCGMFHKKAEMKEMSGLENVCPKCVRYC